jgi:hypothetical protein
MELVPETTLDERVIVLDHEPWYDAPEDYQVLAGQALQPFTPHVIGPGELTRLTQELAADILAPGDIVVAPLMRGALLMPGLAECCAQLDLPVLPLPLSRIPFVTLSADDPADLMAYCEGYAPSSDALIVLPDLLRQLVREGRRRVVLMDTDSATGREAALFRALCRRWTAGALGFRFAVLINEIGDDEHSPSSRRSGAHAIRPDAWILRLRRSSTRYLSHLRFQSQARETQMGIARTVRAAFPTLTRYWDTTPELTHVHGYPASTRSTHSERLHLRIGSQEDGAARRALSAAVRDLDRRAPLRLTWSAGERRERSLWWWLESATATAAGEQPVAYGQGCG